MNLLFVADPLESFKTYKDSTFAMMKEAARRGHTLLATEPRHIRWRRGERVTGTLREITTILEPGAYGLDPTELYLG